jgi:hypothetical protein
MGSACRRERWPRRCSTRPANEHSAEVALRFQVERRGWPAQPHAGHERPARPRATTWPAPPAQTASDRTVRSPNDTWGDQLVPTEATALSSVRPLFLFPEAIQLYDRVVIRAGAGTDCFPAYGLGGHGGQCPPRSRARRRSARCRAAAAPPPEPARCPGLPLLPAGWRPGRRRPGGTIRFVTAVRFYRGGRGSSFRSFAALHYPTTVERGRRGETGQAPPAHRGRGGEAAERPGTSLQCRENVVDLALGREQLRELSTT